MLKVGFSNNRRTYNNLWKEKPNGDYSATAYFKDDIAVRESSQSDRINFKKLAIKQITLLSVESWHY